MAISWTFLGVPYPLRLDEGDNIENTPDDRQQPPENCHGTVLTHVAKMVSFGRVGVKFLIHCDIVVVLVPAHNAVSSTQMKLTLTRYFTPQADKKIYFNSEDESTKGWGRVQAVWVVCTCLAHCYKIRPHGLPESAQMQTRRAGFCILSFRRPTLSSPCERQLFLEEKHHEY